VTNKIGSVARDLIVPSVVASGEKNSLHPLNYGVCIFSYANFVIYIQDVKNFSLRAGPRIWHHIDLGHVDHVPGVAPTRPPQSCCPCWVGVGH
jgi:hypothetical protein